MDTRILLFSLVLPLAACGGAQAPSAVAPTSLPSPSAGTLTSGSTPAAKVAASALDVALSNVDGMLKTPSRDQIEKAFAASFFAQVPEEKVSHLLDDVHAQMGACSRGSVDDRTETSATAHYSCERGGGIDAKVVLGSAADSKITGLLLKPR